MGVLIAGVLGAANYLVLNRFVARIDLIDCVLISVIPFVPAMVPVALEVSGVIPTWLAISLALIVLLAGSWVMYVWRAAATHLQAVWFSFGQAALAMVVGLTWRLFLG